MIRTRYAPSPTGYMHIGNLRTALYEYLIAKSGKGQFILRVEDTDQGRYVEGALETIYKTLAAAGLKYDEGPDIGGDYGPYIQSLRKDLYIRYARELVEKRKAYYCFCTKERLEKIHSENPYGKYDRCCLAFSKEEAQQKIEQGEPYVIRQKIPDGETSYHDEVFGEITVSNEELEDQVLIKSDGLPTYNFANVVDDHLMKITLVMRGNEYLSSTPKYNLLYDAFGWEKPIYVHLPLILNANGEKLSKRKGDASFEDLLAQGFLPEAIINYIALLGWSPGNNQEFFTLAELVDAFDLSGLSKSPSTFDLQKLAWMNGEYFKNMPKDPFYAIALPYLKQAVTNPDIDLEAVGEMVRSRIQFAKEIPDLVDFIDQLPEYSIDLYVHKKMKTTLEIALDSLESLLPLLEVLPEWSESAIHETVFALIKEKGIKNGQMLWPIRTALSGKPSSPCGATELLILLGQKESMNRIQEGIQRLHQHPES